MHKTTSGFTIVELLIVIVVIAILAAISVVSFTNVQSRALENSIRSNLSSISKQLEFKKVDLGRYPENVTEITPINVSRDYLDKTANNVYYCLDVPSQVYSIGIRAKNRKGYMLSNGKVTEVATVNGLATCTHIGLTSWSSNAAQAVLQGYDSTSGNYAPWAAE